MSPAVEATDPAARRSRAWSALLVTGVTVAAGAGYALVRVGAPEPFPNFVGACQRLVASGLPLKPQDWFCRPPPWTMHASWAAASLLFGLAFVFPCAILASTGRRFTALLPLLPGAAGAGFWFFSVSWWGTFYWPGHPVQRAAVNFLLLAAPVVAISFAARGRRRRLSQPRLVYGAVSGVVCGAASAGMVILARDMFTRHLAPLGGGGVPFAIWPAAVSIGLFGALLGPERRWWPWSLAPAAVLLSMGPVLALPGGPEHLQDWSRFGAAAPLAAIGLVCSGWRPFAIWLTTRRERWENPLADPAATAEAAMPAPALGSVRRLRPVVVLDALAVTLLLVSLVLFRADPMPSQLSASLPTYLGLRIHAQDVRAKLDLRRAVAAADAFGAGHGTFAGFDAAAGSSADPALAWRDGLPRTKDAPALTISIVHASPAEARLAALSESGAAFCIQTTRSGDTTFGRVSQDGSSPPRPPRDVLRAAAGACGSTPWTDAAVAMPPWTTMCDGLDASGGYLICRMVQALIVTTLRRTGPA